MLDEALPRFTISESSTSIKHHSSIYLSRPHSDPEPAYTLQHADPAASNSRNCYAAGLVDAYNPEILFGEVLIQPKWTQPSLSQEDIRRNGGIPPPPEPLMPTDFTIQLYNPDQQIQVVQKTSAFLNTTRWEFSLPQDVFRMPSASDLDRSQHDPLAASTTPQINFAWRKESKFGKEMTCYMTGRSTDITQKKKSKEPDMAIAHFKGLKDMTIYEPNLYRMELEDQKGFEVALLLCAATIRDVFYARDLGVVFNISGSSAATLRRESAGSPTAGPSVSHGRPATPVINGAGAAAGGLYARPHANSLPNSNSAYGGPLAQTTSTSTPQPPLDPRAAWELEAETARLRAAAEAEARTAAKASEKARRERERLAEEETRRLRKVVEKEERDRQRRDREEKERVEKETERLRKLYGVTQPGGGGPTMSGANQSQRPPGANSAPIGQGPFAAPPQPPRPTATPQPQPQFSYGYQIQHQTQYQPGPPPQQQQQQQWTPNQGYAAHFGNQSSTSLNPSQPGRPGANGGGRLRRKSFLNIMGEGKDADRMRKRSSVF